MLESRNVRRCFLVHLARSIRDALNIRIVVPTETGIATTVQSRGLLMKGLLQRVLCIRIQNWGGFFWQTCERCDPKIGVEVG